jgi:hypothetical protein
VVRGRNVARLLYYLYGPGKANERMREALMRAGVPVRWPGRAARPQRAQSRQADAASQDFPTGLWLDPATLAAASATSEASPERGRGYQPPKRAGPGR